MILIVGTDVNVKPNKVCKHIDFAYFKLKTIGMKCKIVFVFFCGLSTGEICTTGMCMSRTTRGHCNVADCCWSRGTHAYLQFVNHQQHIV